jgi:hypothetical protein
MVRVGDAGINGANGRALTLIKMTDALGASIGVDDVNFIAGGDSLVGAFRFASTAVDAFFCDFVSHALPP